MWCSHLLSCMWSYIKEIRIANTLCVWLLPWSILRNWFFGLSFASLAICSHCLLKLFHLFYIFYSPALSLVSGYLYHQSSIFRQTYWQVCEHNCLFDSGLIPPLVVLFFLSFPFLILSISSLGIAFILDIKLNEGLGFGNVALDVCVMLLCTSIVLHKFCWSVYS